MARRSKKSKGGRKRGLHFTVGSAIDAAPAVLGAVGAIKGAMENYNFYKTPQGIIGLGFGSDGKPFVDKNAVVKVAGPLVGGAIASAVIHKVRTSRLTPAPAKKLLSVKVI